MQAINNARTIVMAWWTRASASLRIGAGCAALLLTCVICAALAGIVSGHSGATSAPMAVATPTHAAAATHAVRKATPVPTLAPTATADPNATAPIYAAVIQTDTGTLAADFGSVHNDCGVQSAATCYADLQRVATDTQSFVDDLNAMPAPPCLTTVDGNLRVALADYEQAAQEGMDGITESNADLLNASAADFSAGTAALGVATTALKSAQCN